MSEPEWYQRLHWRAFLLFLICFVALQVPLWLAIEFVVPENPQRAARRALGIAAIASLTSAVIAMFLGRRYLRRREEATRRRIDGVVADERSFVGVRDEMSVLADHAEGQLSALRTKILTLQQERGRLRGLLKGMGEAVVMLDETERVLVANPVAERLLRLPDKYIGKRLVTVCEHRQVAAIVSEVLWSEDPATHEIDVPGKRDEIRHLTVSASPLITNDVVLGVVLVLTDVTRLRRLERVRRDFVGNVSHELRTPIASIRSSAETLLVTEGLELDDVVSDFLETIERNAVRMSGIVEDLLTLSRLEAAGDEIALREVNLAPTFAELYDRCLPLAQDAGVDFAMEVEEDLPSVFVEEGAVRQILQNLAENAIKYTPQGGKVAVSAKRKSRKRIRVTVKDSGIGIPAEHLSRIFERFYRVDVGRSREVGGTGLGLAIVKHLVRKLKGRISVESEEGEGTTFTLWFRVYRPEKAT